MITNNYESSPWRVFKQPSLLFNSFFWWDVKYQIEAWFNPRQKWLTKTIPNTWCDKTTLIPNILFTCIEHYVEKEDGLSQLDVDWSTEVAGGHVTQNYVDDVNITYSELRDVYNYVKHERAALQTAHDNSYPKLLPGVTSIFAQCDSSKGSRRMLTCEEQYGMSYAEAYAETNRLETLIAEKDMWAMQIIIKHHQILWT
jgi:hypothetical protein